MISILDLGWELQHRGIHWQFSRGYCDVLSTDQRSVTLKRPEEGTNIKSEHVYVQRSASTLLSLIQTDDKMAEKITDDLKHTQSIKEGTINDASTAEALTLCRDADDIEISPELDKSLRWKLDLRLMPLLCFTYALQSIDKNTISYAAVFGLREDLNLKGDEFSWTGGIFYLGYLVWEFPTSIFLQRFPINYFMSGTVSPFRLPFH